MWIKVLKTWCGIEGMFVGGQICEVDEAVLKKIGNKKLGKKRLKYKQVPALWDAQKDETAVRVGDLQKAIAAKESQFGEMKQSYDLLGELLETLAAVIKELDGEEVKSEQAVSQLMAKHDKALANAEKAPSEANMKRCDDLHADLTAARRAVARSGIVVKMASLNYELSGTKRELLALDGDCLLNEIEILRAELYELRPDLKPKEDEDGSTEKTEAPDGSGPADGKDAADAEGQTDAPGQADAVQE